MADTSPSNLPAFASRLLSLSDSDRTTLLDAVHADYTANIDQWTLLLEALEGTGGFQTGEHIWFFPNETESSWKDRKKQARYHNHAAAIIDQYVQQVFTQEPNRQTQDQALAEWWKDVDGQGTSMTAFLRKQVALALAAGHVVVCMDKTPDAPSGPAQRDEKARPFLVSFRAPAVLDWRLDGTTIIGIKAVEAAPPVSIADTPQDDPTQTLMWDTEGWARFDADGALINAGTPGLGLVPFDEIRPKPSVTRSFVGRSILGNPSLIKALFNRQSELDNVLRNQGCATLAVEVQEGADVEQAKKQLGTDIGVARALVVNGSVYYVSPDMAIPTNLNDNITKLTSEIYRTAHIRYERDSLQAESAEAIRLQFKEFNEMLQGLAYELQRFELQMVRFYYAWTTTSPAAAEAAFDAANVIVNYPEDFFQQDLRLDLDSWAQGIAMNLGPTMTKRIKKKAVRRIEPELTPEDQQQIDAEIDAQPEEQAGIAEGLAQQLKMGAQTRLGALEATTSGGKAAGDAGA